MEKIAYSCTVMTSAAEDHKSLEDLHQEVRSLCEEIGKEAYDNWGKEWDSARRYAFKSRKRQLKSLRRRIEAVIRKQPAANFDTAQTMRKKATLREFLVYAKAQVPNASEPTAALANE